MTNILLDSLTKELELAKKENPTLDSDEDGDSGVLGKSKYTDDSLKFRFLHSSHNSHGDWGKHWAHGSYEDDEPQDDMVQAETSEPVAPKP
jgi:hypothetical protein